MSSIEKRNLTVKRHLFMFSSNSNFPISFSSFVKFVFKILFRQLIFHLTSQSQSSPPFIEFDYNWERIALRETSYRGRESIIVVQSTIAWWLSLSRICLLQWKDDKEMKMPEYSEWCSSIFLLLQLLKLILAQSECLHLKNISSLEKIYVDSYLCSLYQIALSETWYRGEGSMIVVESTIAWGVI